MKHNTRDNGNALIGIIIIIVVLLVGGIYFWNVTKKQVTDNRAAQQALETQSATAQKAFEDSFTNDDAGEGAVIQNDTDVKNIDSALSSTDMSTLTK